MKETRLIEKIERQCLPRGRRLKVGIGDDASVTLEGKKEILVTCEALIENIHFKKKWGSWEQWGKKAAGAALSDIAAMGGIPRFCWVHLSLPKNFKEKEVQKFYSGLKRIFRPFGTVIAGGNICRSPRGFTAVLTIQGERAKGVKMLRSDAKRGDLVCLSGPVGLSKTPFNPKPEIRLGAWLAKNKIANACIDVSDGLLKDLSHIARASKIKIVLEAKRIPFAGRLKQALTRGEDYVLAFTVPPSKRSLFKKRRGLYLIGTVQRGKPGVVVLDQNQKPIRFLKPGYEHF